MEAIAIAMAIAIADGSVKRDGMWLFWVAVVLNGFLMDDGDFC